MLRQLLHRPIAVSMCLIALVVMGYVATYFIPVSLMPDIDIPRITVQAACPGYSAEEVERRVTGSLRGQLMQIGGIEDIRSESRADAGNIWLTFEPGTDTDLLFIEVNEKIDRAMNYLPRELDRPKVIKAGAMDIPAFYLDLSLKDSSDDASARFAELGRFAKGVVSKRIEGLPETAMVDVSGTVGTEIVCIPDEERMQALGIGTNAISQAIQKNNITLEALSIVDGIYRYHIHFDSRLLTKEDIAGIYIKHEDRLLRLDDLCHIDERIQSPTGIVRHDGKRAVTMAIIKQNDAQMEDLRQSMETLMKELEREYPKIAFNLTRDQTFLLSFTMENLKSNLWIGAILACLVLFVFMRKWRLSLLIVCSIPLALVFTLLAFYASHISLNIISLSGLILGVGMIVDNSIIVIDNISRRWRKEGEPLADAVVKGTREVFMPMLSSVLTTCSVFIPLIFLSGTAGSLFYDQAMGITYSLFASLFVAVMVVPVYYYALYRNRSQDSSCRFQTNERTSRYNIMKPYERTLCWVLRHGRLFLCLLLLLLPATWFLFQAIEKQRMPDLPNEDALLAIDWNTGISTTENDRRVQGVMDAADTCIQTFTSMSGTQEFLLSHTKDITSSEAVVYFKSLTPVDLKEAKHRMSRLIHEKYPKATFEFGDAGNIYSLMFRTDENDLEIHLQDESGNRPDIAESRRFIDSLQRHFPDIPLMPVAVETNIRYVADMEQMALHKVSYSTLLGRLKALVSRGRMFEINDGAGSVPVILGHFGEEASKLLSESVINDEGVPIPLHLLVREERGEHYKRLQAGTGGEYYGMGIKASDKEAEAIMAYVTGHVRKAGSNLSATFAGSYFSSRELIAELLLVLTVALALLFFILAAQFESLMQPLIILLEMLADVFFVLLFLWLTDMSVNLMSMIGLVVMSGIIINDSILKVDTINRLRREDNYGLLRAILVGGQRRLRPIVMTSLTTILGLVPFLSRDDMGSALQYPMSVTLIIGMTVGTLVSLFIIPLLYFVIYRHRK